MQRPDAQAVVRAYRELYRWGLRAVQYSVPARYVLRKELRAGFRDGNVQDFDRDRITNTVGFFKNAAAARGIEHKILKNLIHVHYYEREEALRTAGRSRNAEAPGAIAWMSKERKEGYRVLYNTIKVLNETHQLYLR